MIPRGRPKIVLLGMMTKIPVAGVVWQTIHYLVGLQRLGFDPYYIEAHARTPGMLMRDAGDDSGPLAAGFLRRTLARFALDGRWAYQALHDDGRVYGMSEEGLWRLYASAELIVNLHGGTEPRPEHYETGRLVYVETDPVQLQVELHDERQDTIDFLEPHVAFFTFGENYGRPGCGLPVSDRFTFRPTRQPVVLDFWLGGGPDSGRYTTVGNWSQAWRDVTYNGERYGWSKDREFRKFLGLPYLTGRSFELSLASYTPQDRELLESRGWGVRDAHDLSTDPDAYRSYIQGSRAEFTVAKDQNVRLRTGWFSDRGATYLAAGRPVVTQDTGFGSALPTGEALFPSTSVDDAAAAIETIEADYPRARREAFELAREYFDANVVLGQLLEELGVSLPGRRQSGLALPATLDLVPVSRRPMTLLADSVEAAVDRPIPETGGDRLGPRSHDVSVVVVAFEGVVFTRLCLESVLLNSAGVDAEVVVVDNGSTDGTRDYLAALAERDSRVRVLRNNENLGFGPAVNQGLNAATGDVLVLLNNDTVVPPGALSRLTAHCGRSEVGLVGPTTNHCGNEAEVDAPYRTYGEMLQVAARRAAEHAGVAFDLEVATLFCAAMRREVFERIGLLDARFEVGFFEDDDYSERMRAAGYRVVCAEDAFVHHFGEASFGELVPTGRYGELFRANKARFEEKWGVTWQPHLRRPTAWYRDLVERIRELVERELPPGATVLVVSNGDDELLQLGVNRTGWHFPQMEDGTYAGYHPGDSAEAIEHLEALRNKGAGYILFPETAAWWLEYYDGFADVLRHNFRATADLPGTCVIFGENLEERSHACAGRTEPEEASSGLLTFRDVVVTPFTELMGLGLGLSDHRGGPEWPSFEDQIEARHCRAGEPVDVCPAPAQSEPRWIDHPVAWAGPITFHFGHQICDFSMRLLPTLRDWPEAVFLFGTRLEGGITSIRDAPRFFSDVLDWFGIAPERVEIVKEPVVARILHVAPQAEQLAGPGPAAEYLDALDALTSERLGEVRRSGVVFVSRAGTPRPMAGETYLEKVFDSVGVRVVRPETLPLREQLRTYASAEMLIFTEGSALHGTQLLGRALGDVVILNRRQGYRLGHDSLVPRSVSLRYSEVAGPMVHGLTATGLPAPWLGIALYDESKLVDELTEFGIDVGPIWQSAHFTAARDSDVARWIENESASPRGAAAGFRDTVQETLEAAGLRHSFPRVDCLVQG